MMDFERFQPYWRRTKWLAMLLLSFWGIAAMVALCFGYVLDEFRFFGFPIGLLVVGPGIGVLGVALMFWFVGAQDEVDQYFGANEDL